MNNKHLWWIIPLFLFIGLGIGYVIGYNTTVELFRGVNYCEMVRLLC